MNTIIQFMKRHYKILVLVLAISLGLWSFIPKTSSDPEKDKLLLELLTYVIEKGHYNPAAIDDNFSKGVYKDYFEAIDPSKRFFLQSDMDEFSKYELDIDDQIRNKDLSFFNLTYTRLIKRMEESKEYYKSVLKNPIDYSVNENINTDYEKAPYCTSVEELKERWRKQVKLTTLASLVEKQKIQEEFIKNKNKTPEEKLAEYRKKQGANLNKEAEAKFIEGLSKKDTISTKTFAEMEKQTRITAEKSLDDTFTFIKDLNKEDWFGIFLNIIATRFDPHTSYFPADEKEKFDVSMSGKLEGIGARLQKKNDYTEITELISGGPAWKQKELEAGDLVLKVAQG